MFSTIRNADFKSAGLYTFSNFFAKGLSFLLIPVFTNPKFLSMEDNGLLNLYSQSVIFVLPFIRLSIIQSTTVDFFTFKKKEFQNMCVTGLAMAAVTSALALVCFYLFRHLFYQSFDFPTTFLWAIPLLAFFTFIYDLVLSIIRNQENAPKFLKISGIKIITELGLAIILIVIFSWNWSGRVAGLLISTGATAAYGIYFLYKSGFLNGTIKRKIIIGEFKFSVPVVLMQVSMFCLVSTGSFLLSSLTGDNALVGIFGLAVIFGTVVLTFSNSLLQFFIPKVNKELAKSNPDYRLLYRYFKNYNMAVGGWFILLLFIVPAIYYLFINPIYHAGISYYFYISAGFLFWSTAYFLYLFPLFFKQKMVLTLLGVSAIVISVSLNYFFILNYGATGAAIALMLSYFLILLIALFLTRQHLNRMFTGKTYSLHKL